MDFSSVRAMELGLQSLSEREAAVERVVREWPSRPIKATKENLTTLLAAAGKPGVVPLEEEEHRRLKRCTTLALELISSKFLSDALSTESILFSLRLAILRWSKWSILLNSSEDKKVPDTIVSLIRKRSQERRSPASLAFMDIALRVAQEVSPDDIALRTSLLEPLVSTAEESVKLARKTPHVTQCRSAALFALAAGVTLDANNSLALNVAKDSSGFFYDHAYFDKSSDAEAEAQILIVRRLLHLPESPLSDFAQIISLGLTHRTSEAIRKNTLQVLSDVLPKIEVSRSEMLILHLIPALLKRVCNLEDQNLSCYTYTDKAILAIQAILPSSIFSSENIPVLIQFCVLAHHPFFCKRISKQNRSRAFERFLKVNLEEWNNLVDNSSNTLVKTIFTNLDYGCLSRRSLASKSAMHLILSLLSSRLAESLCSDFLTGVLIDCLETCTLAISSLSEYEISCFLVKEGEICEPQNQIADSSLSDLQTSHKKKDKKNSQKESDAEWEARIAKEVAEKRMREELSEKLHSGAIFEEQRKNREKVKLLMNPAMVVFRFLQLISCRVPKLVHEFLLVDMVPSISRAGKFNLLRSSSIETLLSLVSTMEPKLGYAKEKHLALALSLLYRNDFSFFLNDFWASEQLLESLRVIVGVSKRQMPPQSLSIVLSLVSPIVLRDVDMRASDIYAVNELNSLDIREKLFEFLRYQCDSNNIDPQKRHLFPASTVLNLLVNAISRFPNFRKICGESMVNIGEMLNLNHIDQVFGYDVLLSAFDCVRSYTLEMLENSSLLYLPLQDRNIAAIFILTCDQESSVASKATRIFNSYGLELSIGVVEELVNFSVSDKCSRFCFAISKSFFNLLSKKKDFITISWSLLFDQWVKQMDIQIEDDFGRIVDKQDNHLPRKSLLQIMASICPLLDDSLALKMFEFLITDALVDINENVWIEALNTSLCLIESHGKVHSSKFLSLLEDTLEKSSSIGNKKTFDQVNEALVILMGSTAKFLQNDSRRIIDVITSLISVLPTPSHSVQTAAARCLSPLIRLIDQEDAKISLIQKLIQQSCESTSFAQRRGFSYGVGGLLAGVKLSYVRKYGILETVIDYSASSNPISREGALFVFESLFAFIGYLFEPYAVKILPSLLRCFSDTSTLVRDAALQATRSIMETLSSHGVKLILPILLKSLQDPQWRTKVESINMLGLMSFCAPKQLSSSLPIVVPRLIEILKDPHAKVRTATEKALHDIGSVINNEEIRVLVPILLDAIYNPEKKTELALTTLIETSFVNAVDSPSLALLMPILIRGLRERSSLVKRMAAQVIGSLCSFLRSSSDILPYVDPLLVELKSLIVDPSPDVRAACSKAIGRLFMDVGEQYLITLIAWLMNMLQGETSSVEQSGGAQALSELLCALGLNYIDEYLDSILALCSSNNHRIRESFLRVIMFLPRAFEKDFYFVMERVFPLIIENLKNDRESVRSAALSAAKSIIDILGPIYPCEILDMIEPKLSDSHWRVRENVVILVGDLLHKVSGGNLSIITGDQIEFDDDEDRKPEKEAMIENALGTFRRNQLFSFVYILQYDVASPVRQISWLMWKSVVTNTTRLLNSIINNLIDEIIHALSGSNADEQSAAASSLADLVKRNGDLLIPVIIPILQEGLSSPNESDRQGISAALAEIIESSGRNTMERHFLDFVPLVKCGICDTSFKTRQAAAHAFDALYRSKGKQIVTIIVKPLLEKLGINEESSTIFEGVREILRVRSGPILEELVPLLTADPFDSFQAQSLSSLVAVAGSELSLFIKKVTLKYLHTIDKLGIDSCQEHTDALRVVVSSLDMDSLLLVLGIFFDACIDKKTASSNSVLAAISDIMTHLFKTTEFDLSSQFSEALSCLISLYLSSDIRVQDSSVAALSALVNYGTPQNFVKYAAEIQELISTKTVNIYGYRLVEEIPGFVNVKNGIQPLLAVYQHGLMYGTQNEREKCASGIGQLVEYSNAESLKPYVIKITGPLIRIVGDRFDSSVKAAILSTLSSLLKKASTSMKPFVPQLQTTFLKSLLDESVEVRRCAVIGVSFLMKVNQRKLTSVLTELINRTSFEIDDEQTCGIVSSSIDACSEILRANSEVEVEDSILNSMFELVDTLRNSIHPSVRESIGVLFGMLSCISKNNSLVESALKNLVNVADLIEEADFHGAVVALGECAAYAPHIFTKIYSSAEKVFCKALSHESILVRKSSIQAIFKIFEAIESTHPFPKVELLLDSVVQTSYDERFEVRLTFFSSLRKLSKNTNFVSRNLRLFGRPLLNARSDISNAVQVEGEKALYFALKVNEGKTSMETVIHSVMGVPDLYKDLQSAAGKYRKL